MSKTDLSRRTFLKATGALGTAAAAGAGVSFAGSLASGSAELAHADQEERIVWSHCHVNCGGACVLRFHMQGDEIKYVETDNTGSAEFGDIQMRACLRGRSIRRWIDHPDRLNYPLKRREGTKRGEGVYDQITWDEALDTIASEFTRIKETYGNESIFIQECSGVEQNIMMNSPFFRLFNLLGGEVTRYGNYSNAAINFGSNPFTYGDGWGRRSFKSLQKGQLVVLFGDSVMDMRMGGDGAGYDLNVAMEKQGVRVIMIDPRRNEVATNKGAEWIPIRPGTDAALVAGIAHELETLGLTDHDFLKKYCVGYSEDTLPEGAPKNSSYYAYIMGTGYDKGSSPRRSARPSRCSSPRAGACNAMPTAISRPAPSCCCRSWSARWESPEPTLVRTRAIRDSPCLRFLPATIPLPRSSPTTCGPKPSRTARRSRPRTPASRVPMR